MMRRVVLFDPVRGAAGDMIIGALLDAGASKEDVLNVMASVGEMPSVSRVDRAGICAVSVDTHADDVCRSFVDVIERVERCSAPASVISMAKRVFERIARAEYAVHHGEGTIAHNHPFDPPSTIGDGGSSRVLAAWRDVHFHEVGADDAIADVLGACMAMHLLSPGGVLVRPVAVGSGEVMMSHGKYPIPAPATVAIFKESALVMQMSVSNMDGTGELCTPTGAALLAEFAASFPFDGECLGSVCAVGYGAGKRNPVGVSNVLRVMIFEVLDEGFLPSSQEAFTVDVLSTNVDDVTGEVISFALSELMKKGARDAVAVPIVMKKGRPGFLVQVIALPEDSVRLSREMARLLGTLGVRCVPSVHRFVAEREFLEVSLLVNEQEYCFLVKCGFIDGECFTLKPEFDAVQSCALAEGVSLLDLMRLVESKARKMIGGTIFPNGGKDE